MEVTERELLELRADAERYRFLKERVLVVGTPCVLGYEWHWHWMNSEGHAEQTLDEMIDVALGKAVRGR
jgi:hypothetical protein